MTEKTRIYLDRNIVDEAYDLVREFDGVIPNLAKKDTITLDKIKGKLYVMEITTHIDTEKKEIVQDVYVGNI